MSQRTAEALSPISVYAIGTPARLRSLRGTASADILLFLSIREDNERWLRIHLSRNRLITEPHWGDGLIAMKLVSDKIF